MAEIIPFERIEQKIYFIRGKKVMLDQDLAALYGVTTKRLNEQVTRNIKRFPEDFMFRLDNKEHSDLRSQIATSKRGGRRYLPFVFTEQGVAMLSSVLNSEGAVQVNIQIMRTFIKLRELHDIQKYFISQLNRHGAKLIQHDKQFEGVFQTLDEMREMRKTAAKKKMGFVPPDE